MSIPVWLPDMAEILLRMPGLSVEMPLYCGEIPPLGSGRGDLIVPVSPVMAGERLSYELVRVFPDAAGVLAPPLLCCAS